MQQSRRRPIFPKGCPLSIFGAGELNFRVRDGNGCGLSARVTRILNIWTSRQAARRDEVATAASYSKNLDVSRCAPASFLGRGADHLDSATDRPGQLLKR